MRNNTRTRPILTFVALVMLAGSVLSLPGATTIWSRGGAGLGGRLAHKILCDLRGGVLAIFIIYCIRRNLNSNRRALLLLIGFMFLDGGFTILTQIVWLTGPGILGEDPAVCVPHFKTLWYYVYDHAKSLGYLTEGLLTLGCGIVLSCKPAWIKAVTRYFLLGAVIVVIASGFQSITTWGFYYHGFAYWPLPYLSRIALGVLLYIWVTKHMDIFVPISESCGNCGYNLTGNISGICSECGERI